MSTDIIPETKEPPQDAPVPEPTMRQLIETFRLLVDEASRAQYQIAVPIRTAATMLGFKDTSSARKLIHSQGIRTRKAPGSKTELVSVQSLREYMGDLPRKRGSR